MTLHPSPSRGCGALEEDISTSSHLPFLPLSVLDLNAFERQNKAEGLGMVNEDGTGEAFSWASLSMEFLFPSGSAPYPTLPRVPFLQDTPSPKASPGLLSPTPCSSAQSYSQFLQGLPLPH